MFWWPIYYIVVLVNQNIAHNHRFTLIFFVPLILSRITCQSPPSDPCPPLWGGDWYPPMPKSVWNALLDNLKYLPHYRLDILARGGHLDKYSFHDMVGLVNINHQLRFLGNTQWNQFIVILIFNPPIPADDENYLRGAFEKEICPNYPTYLFKKFGHFLLKVCS